MACIYCNTIDKTVYRTAPMGESPAKWMCLDCISLNYPLLADKIIKQNSTDPLISDLEEILNKKPC